MSLTLRLFIWLVVITNLPLSGLGPAAANGSIRVGVQTLPAGLGSPYGSFNLATALPLDAVFDGLTLIGASGDIEPALAVSWQADTPLTWVFQLREGVAFSNGEPFDARAVVAAAEVLQGDAAGTSLGTTFKRLGVTGVSAQGDFKVAFTLAQPNALFAQYMSALRIPAPAALSDAGLDGFALAPVGTGPFHAMEWGEANVRMTAFKGSWRAPALDGLEILQLADGATRRQGILSGSLDVAFGLAPEDKDLIEGVGGRMWVRPEPGVNFLAFITVKDSPLQDVRVRHALNHAVNKQRIIDAFLDGAVPPASQIAHSMSFGVNTDLQPYAYDPERARKLLAEAGYAGGFDMPTLVVPGGNANSQDWYQLIAQDLAAIGVRVELRASTLPRYLEYMYSGGWPSLAFGMPTYTFDPIAGYRIRSCAWTHPYHCDPEIMPLIEAAQSAATLAERRDRTFAVLRHEHENPPGIFLWQGVSFEGLGPRIGAYWSAADTVRVENITVRD